VKTCLTIFLVILSLFVSGQTNVYHPFPDSNATWCDKYIANQGCINMSFDSASNTYQLAGDTSINGLTYHKLLHYYAYYDNCSPYYFTDIGTEYIRQDVSQKKVWWFFPGTQRDTILYDFNLNVGDTITAALEYWAAGTSFIVSSIDSILINGNYRKRFNYFPQGMQTCFASMVEGIGGLHGLKFIPSNCFEYFPYLTRFVQDSQVLYTDSFFTSLCYDFVASVNENIEESHEKFSPNPFHLATTLELNGKLENVVLIVYDSFGQQVKRQKINSQSTTINRDRLNAGIYFYQITNDKGLLKSGKLVIE
jgi:hypothetical protein